MKRTFTTEVGKLSGKVVINGSELCGESLVAVVSDVNVNAGKLTYSWYRSGETAPVVSQSQNPRYLLTAKDAGHTISVTVNASETEGTLKAETWDKVS